ncbi:MAG: RNase H family protein [Chloroflexota bacterium]
MVAVQYPEPSPDLLAVSSSVESIRESVAERDWGKYFVAYTDGSCRGMGGAEGGPGGWGMVLFTARGQRWETHGTLDSTTSNRAEVCGLIAALLCAPEGSHISVQSDSRYVVDHVRRWMNASDNDDLWTEVRELVLGKGIQLQATWVAGHNGNTHNERADVLASHGTRRIHRRRRG